MNVERDFPLARLTTVRAGGDAELFARPKSEAELVEVALQQALKRAGFDPGREDGRVDERTMNAVRAFQQAKSLPVDSERYINMATVKALAATP